METDGQDEFEEEYGEHQVIYIAERSRSQLERAESWWKPIPFSDEPSDDHRIRTSVPKSALKGGKFHPDRCEPEIVLERCEEVPEASLKKTRPRRFRKGDRVKSTLHGPGAIVTEGYHGGTVTAVRDGKVRVRWDDDEDPESPLAYHPETGEEVEPALAGMYSKIALLPAVTKAAKPEKRKRRRK